MFINSWIMRTKIFLLIYFLSKVSGFCNRAVCCYSNSVKQQEKHMMSLVVKSALCRDGSVKSVNRYQPWFLAASSNRKLLMVFARAVWKGRNQRFCSKKRYFLPWKKRKKQEEKRNNVVSRCSPSHSTPSLSASALNFIKERSPLCKVRAV